MCRELILISARLSNIIAARVNDFDSAPAVMILSRHSGLKVRLSSPVIPRTGKKIPPTLWAEGFEFDDFRRAVDRFDDPRMLDGLAFEAAGRAVVVVRIKLAALPFGHAAAELLSDPFSDVVAELFDRPKAGRLQINVSAVNPFGHQFLGEPIYQSVEPNRIL